MYFFTIFAVILCFKIVCLPLKAFSVSQLEQFDSNQAAAVTSAQRDALSLEKQNTLLVIEGMDKITSGAYLILVDSGCTIGACASRKREHENISSRLKTSRSQSSRLLRSSFSQSSMRKLRRFVHWGQMWG